MLYKDVWAEWNFDKYYGWLMQLLGYRREAIGEGQWVRGDRREAIGEGRGGKYRKS